MAQITVHEQDVDLDSPVLVEGLPGIGLVGKIAVDHLIDEFEMTFYASVHCEGLPRLGTYQAGDSTVRPPVRIYADQEHDLLALQSDVPISAGATSFSSCVTGWLDKEDVLPLYLSGLGTNDRSVPPELYGVATGTTGDRLDDLDIDPPREDGAVTGPTGALLHYAAEVDFDSIGLIVETHPQFPDPEAAKVLIERGIGPIAEIDPDTEQLVEQADEIQERREELAQTLQEADDTESSQAQPLRMFQ